ncbi:hypothetical protein DOY81_012256 [Sarcophaga bullata]|nr:hypothetical protein DOY81_012256 [Sarcophaga bullata]
MLLGDFSSGVEDGERSRLIVCKFSVCFVQFVCAITTKSKAKQSIDNNNNNNKNIIKINTTNNKL